LAEIQQLPRTVRWQGDSDAQMFRNICNDLDEQDNRHVALAEKLDRNTQALFVLAGSVLVAAIGIIGVLLAAGGK
jgi:hypothetical protein